VKSIAAVEEITYRQSRLCRLLSNPVAFAVVALLTKGKDLSTSEIAKAIGRSVPRTSNILGALRLAELVRYETLWAGIFRLTINFAAVSNPENS
jgi:DNA-binding IclR family transcriptional regulator